MIKSMYVNNYKTFVNFSISFDKLSVLIGSNGSGKSNILSLVATIASFARGQFDTKTCFPIVNLTKWMSSDTQVFELSLEQDDDLFEYHLEIKHSLEDGLPHVLKEEIHKNGKGILKSENGQAVIVPDSGGKAKDVLLDDTLSAVSMIPNNPEYTSVRSFRKQMNNIIICTPNPKTMNELVQNDIFFPSPGFDNIASAYTGITQMHPEIINDLWNSMKNIDLSFVRSKVGLGDYNKYLSFIYNYNGKEYEYHFSELSDGERMLFSLYLLLYGYILQGMSVLLDEPDNYLSLREIQPWCIELEQLYDTDGQCILVSHHPEVIDYYADNNGVWLSRLPSGETINTDNPYYQSEEDRYLTYSELIARGEAYEA